MIARCAQCQEVFTAETFGRQHCPRCGAELMLNPPKGSSPDPGAPGPEAGEGPPPAPPPDASLKLPPAGPTDAEGPQDQSTPWEERATRGPGTAYVETLRKSMLEPVAFFTRMRVDVAEGAVKYFWINAGIGGFSAELWQALLSVTRRGQSFPMTLPNGEPIPFAEAFSAMNSPSTHLVMAVAMLLLAPVGLYLWSGLLHLGALIFGAAGNGFLATRKAVAYASGPNLLQLIPCCGGLLALGWYLVLLVIGIWKAQRTSVGGVSGRSAAMGSSSRRPRARSMASTGACPVRRK
jgi:hypothetical protein